MNGSLNGGQVQKCAFDCVKANTPPPPPPPSNSSHGGPSLVKQLNLSSYICGSVDGKIGRSRGWRNHLRRSFKRMNLWARKKTCVKAIKELCSVLARCFGFAASMIVKSGATRFMYPKPATDVSHVRLAIVQWEEEK